MKKCLIFADLFINEQMMRDGFKPLEDIGYQIDIRNWYHDSLEALQDDNILLEHEGSEAIELPESFKKNLEDYEIIITQFAPIGKDIINKAKNLKILGVLRGGTENICKEYAESKGITVFNTMGRSNISVSEFTVGLMISESRNIARSNYSLKNGEWRKKFPNGTLPLSIKSSTIGLIGYGSIGKEVAKLLSSFGPKIIVNDDYIENVEKFEKVSKDELLKRSDIISIHTRLTKETKNMIDYEDFDKMKNSAIIINTARSGLIREKALLDALINKKIASASIDVFDIEPLPKDHPFTKLDNITITSHIAGSTLDNFKNSPNILVRSILNKLNE
ncbi:2-hydroxyacid dehydrogenase [Anaerococcus sp. AGMB00486]|uniref:2-hydroxyacid dehydrogenase n=2 Tax=Anaerococcus TaxID=165779 RepID=A0ABX2NAS7_9FIRM|nr:MULTISPECIES: 2-hydroxyacid dehydrogenase [Anaerococcus]MSS77737.1 2-hydroxyacid dehydrogenase [Anaerococcus porci]NVF11592.1 2-hydroxyacid dehydrogenase [Anaerococcus faecalis]